MGLLYVKKRTKVQHFSDICKKMGDFFWKIRKNRTATLFQRSQVAWEQAQPALDAGAKNKEASATPALSTSRAGRRFYPPNLADAKETADARCELVRTWRADGEGVIRLSPSPRKEEGKEG